jgi:hypothetical protein
MEELNIVIVGSSAIPEILIKDPLVPDFGVESKGQTPSLDNYLEAKLICKNNNINMKLFLIDPNYNIIKDNSADKSEEILNEYNLLTLLEIHGVEVIPLHFHKWDNYLRTSGKDIPISKQIIKSTNNDFNENIIYVSYNGSLNTYEFMTFLETSRTDNRWYYIPKNNDKCDVSYIVTEYINNTNVIINPYNIYSGNKLTEYISSNDLIAAKSYFKIGCILAVNYINAGFNSYDANLPLIILDSWNYQCETPFLKGIILYYGLYSESADRSTQSEMITSAASRRTITFTICKVLSNFAINNNIITIEEVTELGGWFMASVYEIIYNRLDDWLV